jgi:hypothetical protein
MPRSKDREIPHGTDSSYSNFRCRCSECRQAHAQYKKSLRAKHANSLGIKQKTRRPTMEHGTLSMYKRGGCRCGECKKASSEYWANYYKENISRKISGTLRRRLSRAVGRRIRGGSAVRDLGCSVDFFIQYLENQFIDGMTWDNFGDWQIDHIRPLSTFDLSDRNDILVACHYTNLRPLWRADNLRRPKDGRDVLIKI